MSSNAEIAGALMAMFPDNLLELTPDGRRRRLEEVLADAVWPDFEVAMVAPGGWGAERVGFEGFTEGWGDWLEPFESFRMEFEEFVEGEDSVVVFVRQFGTPKGGGPEIESPAAGVLIFRAGKIARMEFHLDRDEALRAAGIDSERA